MTSVQVTATTPDRVSADWAALVERTGASPFHEPGWVLAWHRAFGRGRLMVIIARRSGRLVAALPLIVRAGSLRSPTNWHTPEYGITAEDRDAASVLLRTVFSHGPRSVILGFVDSATAAAVQAAAEPLGYRLLVRELERSPYVSIDGPFEGYRHRMPSRRRSELRRRRRRLEEFGPVRLDIRTDSGDAAFAEFVRLEESGWKARSAIARDAQAQGFYADVVRWAADRKLLRIALLRVGERSIAADLAIETSSRHYLLKTGYDPAYRPFAPGMLLRYLMLEHAFAAGLQSYEFLGTDELWKLEWTDRARDRIAVHSFAPSLSGRLEHAAYARGRPLAKAVLGKAAKLLRR